MAKRITALLLSVLLCLTLAGTAFAADGPNGTITGEAGSNEVTLDLTGLGSEAPYYLCSILVKENVDANEEDFSIVKSFNFKTAADGTYKRTFADTAITELKEGNVLRFRIPGVQLGNADYIEYIIPEAPVEVTGVTLDKAEATVEAGKTLQLTATVEPKGAETTLTWKSSNEAAATVDENGVVTGVAAGEATITVTTANGRTAQCVVTVTAPETPAVTMAKTANITVGGSYTLTAAVTPAGSSYNVEWTVSDAELAKVIGIPATAGKPDNPMAKVELTSDAKVGDKFTVTVTVTIDGKDYPAQCEFTVVRRSSGGGGGGAVVSTGYSVTVNSASHGSISASPSRPSKGQTVTITVRPDKGYVLDKLTVKDEDGGTIRTTKAEDNKYTFTMPDGKVTVDATFKAEEKVEEKPAEPAAPSFDDVPSGFWAYEQISWAAKKGIMNGYGGGVFGPDRSTTRQALWMVLARLDGAKPADMAAARAWAISSGVSDGSNPGGAMSRQQMVTMLYRYAQMKGYAVTGGTDISGYPDYSGVSAYARDALSWAVAQGIVQGTASGTLNPAGTASRAHFAVFMYRFCNLYSIA